MAYRPSGLASSRPSRYHIAAVGILALCLIALTALSWPHLNAPGPEYPAFQSTQSTAVVLCDVLTAILLFHQFSQHRLAALLVLACGYLMTAMVVTTHFASYPGMFTDTGLFGDKDTPSWLWVSWHCLFPAMVLVATSVKGRVGTGARRVVAALAACVITLAAVMSFSVVLNDLLPDLFIENRYTPFYLDVVYPLMALVSVAALGALMLRRPTRSVLTLYLWLTVLAFLLDVLVNWQSGARFTVGWYLGRTDSLVASVLLCGILVSENAALLRYANSAASRLDDLNRELKASSLAKSQFFAAANHDLRQPFQAMRLFLEVLQSTATERQIQAVQNLDRSMSSAESLLDQLLDIARLESGTIVPVKEPLDIGELVTELRMVLEPVAAKQGVTLRIRSFPASIASDAVLLKRILFNIASNALRYTSAGGILIGMRRRRGQVLVEVWDTGIGIAKDQLPLIFNEFYQVGNPGRDRSKGIGLGLSIVKRLSALLGLRVQVASRPGRGTVFRVIIPAPEPQEDHRPNRSRSLAHAES